MSRPLKIEPAAIANLPISPARLTFEPLAVLSVALIAIVFQVALDVAIPAAVVALIFAVWKYRSARNEAVAT